ncbi:uncharacterized protein UV8b_03392 [Ustilaginoidea virens]|uniref:Uncharacterized protein n=1 Tax=Ustilaginoidea virens TaxID=1159556 RepID=A0A8E5HPD8_USTVR|nr:uncharacterized protein UV8b_03392 [Ustilaginoidea virens]QUC19151.1 hypothetical protein UV8b_03392 [Ustilaginoidea virens]
MGTRGLKVFRFRGRYYAYYVQYDSYYEGLGATIVMSIPEDPAEYREWLESMRAYYADIEFQLEKSANLIQKDVVLDEDVTTDLGLHEFPTSFPVLDSDFGFIENVYIINLDREILTMNYGIHWKLDNIPRADNLWLRAIRESIYDYMPTVSLELCPEEHLASPALPLPKPDKALEYEFRVVSPRTDIRNARHAFLTHVLAQVHIKYGRCSLAQFGTEWSPDSFPFRELAFSLVSIASGKADFWPQEKFSLGRNRRCSPGWFYERTIYGDDDGLLLEFGFPAHLPEETPGVSPESTLYWLEDDVLVSLTLVVDGKAITEAADFGLGRQCQRRRPFYMVVMSLFEIALAEVALQSEDEDDEPFIRVTRPLQLSILQARNTLSSHPRERPELVPGARSYPHTVDLLRRTGSTGSAKRLGELWPGLCAMVDFFEVLGNRRAAAKSSGIFPAEIWERIILFTDYSTWKACSVASPDLRLCCLREYRVDDETAIIGRPYAGNRFLRSGQREQLLSFNVENLDLGGHCLKMMAHQNSRNFSGVRLGDWVPVISGRRKAAMTGVPISFFPAERTIEDGSSSSFGRDGEDAE